MATTLLLKSTTAIGDTTLPDYALSTAEAAIMALAPTGWWEADSGIEQASGFRWTDRTALLRAAPRDTTAPVYVAAASHGKPALQQSYGRSSFTSTDRGALRLPTKDYFSADGFTAISVVRVPTVASNEAGATVGGYPWACEGSATSSTPRVNISGSTGKPVCNGVGLTISNPTGDMRDGAWHILSVVGDRVAGTLKVFVDKTRWTGTASGTGVAIPAGSRSPVLGRFISASSAPFYGQSSAHLLFASALSDVNRNAAEAYLAGKYGATLI
jgi:hypothetical protein